MELSPCEATSYTATQELTFMELECLVRVHKSPSLASLLSQINPVNTTLSYSYKTHFNTILLPTTRSSWWYFYYRFPTKILYKFLFTPCVLHALAISS
jgi:hypothetical protein